MSFQQGLSGLNASSKALDTIGNNIANSGTVGFKLATTQFADVFAASLSGAGTAPIGLGAKVATVAQQFTQGNISVTSNPLDLAINGGGFFRMENATGDILYSRNGQFQLDKDGYIVNAKGQKLTGYGVPSGTTEPSPPLGAIRLFDPTNSSDSEPNATSRVNANVNLDSRETSQLGAFAYDTETGTASNYNKSTALQVYDSLGNPHVVSLYFVKTDTSEWEVHASVPILGVPDTATDKFTDLGTLATVTFGPAGTIDTVTAGAGWLADPDNPMAVTGTLDPADFLEGGTLTTVNPIDLNFDLTGTTQYGSTFTVNNLLQDGYASGKLAGFNIGNDGIILGRYTNGQSKALGQVQLASFRNPQGLQPLGDNVWAATSTSGAEMIGEPGSSGQYGPLQSSALEDSNVDLTAELVAMITQQRVYQANAQTIKTQDSILQTLVNLR